MKHIVLALFAYAAVILQASAHAPLAAAPVAPHFLMLLMAWAALRIDGPAAILWAAAAGLLSDCLTPDRLGPCMFWSTLCAYGLQSGLNRGLRRSAWAFAPLAFLTVAAVMFAADGSHILFGDATLRTLDWTRTAGTAAGTTLLGLLVMAGCGWMRLALRSVWPQRAMPAPNRWMTLTR